MRKITSAMASALLVMSSFALATVDESMSSTDKVLRKEFYQREDSEEKPLALQAVDGEQSSLEISDEESHVDVATRSMPHAEYVQHQEARALKAREEETASEEQESSSLKMAQKSIVQKDILSKNIYYTSHNGAYHRPVAVTFYGEQVTLEDQSIWNIASWDQWKTLNWLTTDTILVMQNKWLFSSFKFMMVNQNTGKEIECNLLLGPTYLGPYTHWIIGINYVTCEVFLNDGSVWQIDAFDYAVMRQWMLNDTVIIGVNETGCVYHPNILINVNMLNYSCGICIN